MKRIILIGDSIRMGYQPYVTRELEGVAEVWGPEQNGGTSRNVLAHLEEWVLSQPADVVHINCGLHDLARDPDSKGPRVPLDEYSHNVREILSRVQGGNKTIIWATTTPVNEANHKNKGFDRLESDVEAYNAAALQTAQELNVSVNDLNAIVNKAGRDRVLLPDGVHFTEEGSALLGSAVAARLREYF